MSIVASEIKWYQPQVMSDAAGNGGRMVAAEIASGVKNNIWPDVPQAERVAGSTKWRKVFIKIANDDDFTLFAAKLFVETFTPGEDNVCIFLGTQTNTQADLTGSERLYGSAQLASDITAGAGTLTVNTEGAALDYFQAGDTIRVSDKTSVDAVGGNEEYVTISVGGVGAYAGDQVVLTIDETFTNSYTAASTRVASVLDAGDVDAPVGAAVPTTASGTFDDTTYPILGDNIGSIEQTWTLTFTSASAFDIVGDTVGTVGSGNITTDAAPLNGDFAKPYFTLDLQAWGGTWAIGETLVFTTGPAAIPVWYRRNVPAGAASLSGDRVIVAVDGESA